MPHLIAPTSSMTKNLFLNDATIANPSVLCNCLYRFLYEDIFDQKMGIVPIEIEKKIRSIL